MDYLYLEGIVFIKNITHFATSFNPYSNINHSHAYHSVGDIIMCVVYYILFYLCQFSSCDKIKEAVLIEAIPL